MPSVPVLRPRDAVRVFERLGWKVVRQRGSHILMSKPGELATLCIPNHSEVARGTLRGQITQAGLSVDEFLRALGES
jgi:predicted RNA binding protein YcfA (HicA-like mRNA interferase family)